MSSPSSLRALAAAVAALALFAAEAKTKVALFFDTEDYTCDRSNDAIRDLARLLTEEGVRGNFNIVGYLAGRLVALGRQDVVAALRPHVLGSQTLYHSRHPDLAELGDHPDYARAYRDTLRDEARAFGMIEAVFGEGRCLFFCPPGNCVSPVAMDVYSDLGVRMTAGCGFDGGPLQRGRTSPYGAFLARPGAEKLGLWYANMYHLPYHLALPLESFLPQAGRPCPDVTAKFDVLARHDFAGLYMHPHMAVKTCHWDSLNYKKGNLVPWRAWKEAPDRPAAETAAFYARLRAFIRALKADGRFALTDLEAIAGGLRPRVAVTRADLPALRAALARELTCVRAPASWSVADVFQAAVRLLRGETPPPPGKVYGFLSRPRGVAAAVEVSADDLRRAAAALDLETFIPPDVCVGGQAIGPADFLMAALDALVTGAERVTVRPREQLGSFREVPGIERMHLADSWVHTEAFRDAHLSERLRLQLWTLRIE